MPIYVGTQKIDVSGMEKVYVGTQLVYQKNVPIVLSSITISGQTTSLNRGASFSFGGTVTAHYSNGSTANVTSQSTFSGYNMNLGGSYTVTVSYTENSVTKTATYTLTVNKAWSTIWSGTQSATLTFKGTLSGGGNIVSTVAGTGTTPRVRITFSQTHSSYGGSDAFTYYNNSNTASSTAPSSPRDFNTVASTNNLKLLGQRDLAKSSYDGSTIVDNKLYVKKVNGSNNVTLSIASEHSGSATSTGTNLTLKVTKIEQYY